MRMLKKGKRVLIFGLGLNQGGVGAAKFFAKQGAKVKVTDLRNQEILKPSLDQLKNYPNISYTLGEHKNEDIDWADLIIKNPAVKPGNPYINYAVKKDKKVEQDMGIFLQHVKPSQIIGITGTKGKSTTASIIYEVLKSSGKEVILAGNIGKSVLEVITIIQKSSLPPQGWKAKSKDLLIILELSSFQLEAFDQHKVSPKWAIITNIYPDHLNYYQNMDEYTQAKRVIGKYQTSDDFLFINKDDTTINNPKFLTGFKGQINFYSSKDLPEDFHPKLKGVHNLSNIAAAYALGKTFSVSSNLLLKSLSQFKGVPFRMELIKEWDGIKIYNDTAATTPDAGIQALKTLYDLHSHIGSGNTDSGIILIAGGMNKNMSYEEYARVVDEYAKRVFFLEGDSTDLIISSLRSRHLIGRSNLEIHGLYNELERLLSDVKKYAKSGDTILFSPGATSFNMFQNEFDRGRKFNAAVNKIFRIGN